jgi:hypothetical protein
MNFDGENQNSGYFSDSSSSLFVSQRLERLRNQLHQFSASAPITSQLTQYLLNHPHVDTEKFPEAKSELNTRAVPTREKRPTSNQSMSPSSPRQFRKSEKVTTPLVASNIENRLRLTKEELDLLRKYNVELSPCPPSSGRSATLTGKTVETCDNSPEDPDKAITLSPQCRNREGIIVCIHTEHNPCETSNRSDSGAFTQGQVRSSRSKSKRTEKLAPNTEDLDTAASKTVDLCKDPLIPEANWSWSGSSVLNRSEWADLNHSGLLPGGIKN